MNLLDEVRDLRRRVDAAVDLIIDNGDVDGAHHKQWVLDQIARVLCTEGRYRELFSSENWDKGIAP